MSVAGSLPRFVTRGPPRVRRVIRRYKRSKPLGFRALRDGLRDGVRRCATRQLRALSRDDSAVATEASGVVERALCVVETSQTDQRKRTPELGVWQIRPARRDRVVLQQRSPEITARYRQSRQTYSIFERARVGQKARTVRLLSTREVALRQLNQAERMPGGRIFRAAAHGFTQPRLGPIELAPTSGPQASCQRPERIDGRDLGSLVIRGQSFVVAVRHFEGVPQLDQGHGAVRAELLFEQGDLLLRRAELATGGLDAHEQASFGHGLRVLLKVGEEQRARFFGSSFVHQHAGARQG
jgi:hypothetical protein